LAGDRSPAFLRRKTVSETANELSERLKAVRKALNLTQDDLAKRWKCNPNTLGRIEKGNESGMVGLFADAVSYLETLVKK
jgi:DNA-binding XRE family transcriptional regulator